MEGGSVDAAPLPHGAVVVLSLKQLMREAGEEARPLAAAVPPLRRVGPNARPLATAPRRAAFGPAFPRGPALSPLSLI